MSRAAVRGRAVLVGLGLVALGCASAGGDSASAPASAACSSAAADRGLGVGECAPDFSLSDREGQPWSLHAHRGKVALVDISAIW